MQFVLAQSDLFHLLKNRERKKKNLFKLERNYIFQVVGFLFFLAVGGKAAAPKQ